MGHHRTDQLARRLEERIAYTERHLSDRPARAPDHQRENAALRLLAAEMADCPERVLHTLCEQVLAVCGAESSGVSLLGSPDDTEFHWSATAGLWADHRGNRMPRSASPCGEVLDCDSSLILHDVERQFPASVDVLPAVGEVLLAPFRVAGRPIGTVWAIVHAEVRRFDNEDRRQLESLAQVASAAYQMVEAEKVAREARAQADLVSDELGHRLKNMLTMISAVASQTLADVTEQVAVEAFQARVRALGSAHDLLLDQSWIAAPVDVIVRRVIGSLSEQARTRSDGPDVTVGPRSALALALILHELGTNALKYGAFSVPGGRVSFRWQVVGAEPMLRAEWRESGGPPVRQPSHAGFGSRLIRMGMIGTGGVTLAYEADGLIASLEAPLRLAQGRS